MKDPSSHLRTATRRAKSDVANKLVSMFLHELSRSISRNWPLRVDGEEYAEIVRKRFHNRCPYCLNSLTVTESIIEHLDGMNRYRVGLHVPGNVLVACRKCNSEKRRDDSAKVLSLAKSGWESFLSHDGSRCAESCQTCHYWNGIWPNKVEKNRLLSENLQRICAFRNEFTEFQMVLPLIAETLPIMLTKLYADCQLFAENEIKSQLEKVMQTLGPQFV